MPHEMQRCLRRFARGLRECIGVAVLGGLGAAVASAADTNEPILQIHEQQRHYSVDAVTADELVRQLGERLPHEHAQGQHGLTSGSIVSHYRLEPTPDGCRLDASSVRLELTIWLPHWQPRAIVSEALRQQWPHRLHALAEHEQVHRRHAISAAQAIAQALRTPPAAADCKQLKRRIERAIERELLRQQLRDQTFDAKARYRLAASLRNPPAAGCDRVKFKCREREQRVQLFVPGR